MIKVSIITAVHNRVNTILQAIESIDFQSYPKSYVQHIIIDGASDDGTLNLLKGVLNPNSLLISEPDGGIYEALNKGILFADGDIIGLMHSDDFYSDNEVITDVVSIFSDPEVDLVYGDLQYVARNNTKRVIRNWLSGEFKKNKIKWGWMPPHPTVFVRRSFINRVGVFDERYRISADYDWILRCLTNKKVKVKYINRVLIKMRIGGESNSSLKKIFTKIVEDYHCINRNHVGGVITLITKNLRKVFQFRL